MILYYLIEAVVLLKLQSAHSKWRRIDMMAVSDIVTQESKPRRVGSYDTYLARLATQGFRSGIC